MPKALFCWLKIKKASTRLGRGGKNRTHTKGFGDLCSTTKLHPFILDVYTYYNKTCLFVNYKSLFYFYFLKKRAIIAAWKF